MLLEPIGQLPFVGRNQCYTFLKNKTIGIGKNLSIFLSQMQVKGPDVLYYKDIVVKMLSIANLLVHNAYGIPYFERIRKENNDS